MGISYDTYLNRRILKPGGFFGFREYESYSEYLKRVYSPKMVMFRRSRGRFIRRRRGIKRKRGAAFVVRAKRRGYVSGYRRKAFVGRRRFNTRSLIKCIEAKKFITTDINPITLTHTAGSDFQWLFAPMEGMTQGTGRSQFTNNCVWVSGISYACYLGPGSADNDSYHVRFMVFKFSSTTNFSSSAWTETADADTNYQHALLDVNYATVTERFMQLATHNRSGNATLLYDKRIHIDNTNTAAGCNERFFRVWIPLRQLHTFFADVDTDLTAAPNYGRHGDIVFVLTWDNGSHIVGGSKKSLVIGGQTATVYFRDG